MASVHRNRPNDVQNVSRSFYFSFVFIVRTISLSFYSPNIKNEIRFWIFCLFFCSPQVFLNGKFAQRIQSPGRTTAVLCPVNLQEPLTITMNAMKDDGNALPPITVYHPFVIWSPVPVFSLVFSNTAKINQNHPVYFYIYSNLCVHNNEMRLFMILLMYCRRQTVCCVEILYFVYF